MIDLSEKQIDFLRAVLDSPNASLEELLKIIEEKNYKLYNCELCGILILHDNYEFWNITDCCDDNSKLTENGILCEVCYSKSFENLKDWVFFKPDWAKPVKFDKIK